MPTDKIPTSNPRSQEIRANGGHGGITNFDPSTQKTRDGDRIAHASGGYGSGKGGEMVLSAFKDLLNKGKLVNKSDAKAMANTDFTSSRDVVAAIKEGRLAKADAISYADKFRLIPVDIDVDDLTPTIAFKLLEKDIAVEDGHEVTIAEAISPASDWQNKGGEKVSLEDAPSPEGKANPKPQFPSTEVSNESTVNSASPGGKIPKPDGSIDPKKMMPHKDTNQSDVNSAHPESGTPKAKHVGQAGNVDVESQMPSTEVSTESDVNKAKVDSDGKRTPIGDCNPKDQLPSTMVSKDSTVNDAKPEGKPTPESENPSTNKEAKKVNADGLDLLGGAPDMGMDKPTMPPMPMDDAGGPPMAPKHKDHMGSPDKKSPAKSVSDIREFVDFLKEMKEVIDEVIDTKLEKVKEKKPKSLDGAPSEPKGADEKKDSPFPKKDEPKKEEPKEVMSYKVALIKDENPLDSYYLASLSDKNLFSISLRQAFLKEAKEKSEDFHSEEYANLLTAKLNEDGADKVFKEILGSRGDIVAQTGQLPTDKMNAPAQPMNATPAVQQDISNNDSKRESFSDLVMEVLATTLASANGTAQEAVDELHGVFSDNDRTQEFAGRLSEKVESKRKDIGDRHTPDTYNEPPVPQAPNAGPPTPNTPAPDVSKMAAKLAQVKEFLPKFKELAERVLVLEAENAKLTSAMDNRKKDDMLKARAISCRKFADKKAKVGLIDEGDVNQEALRLAKLSDVELNKEVENLEDSLKIANKIKKSADYVKVEENTNIKTAGLLSAIPNGIVNDTIEDSKSSVWSWSKGFKNTR